MKKIFIVLVVLFGCKAGTSTEYGLSKSQVAEIIASIEDDLTKLETYLTSGLIDASSLSSEITSGGGTGSAQATTRLVMVLRKRINDNISKLETLYIPPDVQLNLDIVLAKFNSINKMIRDGGTKKEETTKKQEKKTEEGKQQVTQPEPTEPSIIGYFRATEIGSSISGIDLLSDEKRLFAVSDMTPKIYEYALLEPLALKVVKEYDVIVPHLKEDNKKPSGFESIRIRGNQVFISAEIESGEKSSVLYQGEFTDGKIKLKEIRIDDCFGTDFDVNGGIEGVSMSAGGNIWIINERPFLRDKKNGQFLRLTEIDERGKTTRQFIYELKNDPRFIAGENEYANGVSEIFAVSSSEMFVMERAHNIKTCKTYINIFRINTNEAGKTLKDCKNASYSDVLTKEPVYSLADTYDGGKKVDNFEGMSSDLKRTLLLISDNNESKGDGRCPQQFTDIIAVQLK